MKRWILITSAWLAVSGCATKYTCGQYPKSGCKSVTQVYNETNDGFYDYRQSLYAEPNKNNKKAAQRIRGKKTKQAFSATSHSSAARIAPVQYRVKPMQAGDPILTKPVVMRILFNAWEDKNKDLNAGGFVYVKVRDSQWLMGN